MYSELRDLGAFAYSRLDRAGIALDRGDPVAINLFQEVETLFRELRDEGGVSHALEGQGIHWAEAGRPDQALIMFSQVVEIRRRIRDPDGLCQAPKNEVNALIELNGFEAADSRSVEQEEIARRIGAPVALEYALGLRARILIESGATIEAELKLAEAFHLARSTGDDAEMERLTEIAPLNNGTHEARYCASCRGYRIFRRRAMRGMRCANCGGE